MAPGIHLLRTRQTIGACPDCEKETKRRKGMEWSAFGRQHNVMKSNLPSSLRRKGKGENNAWYNME